MARFKLKINTPFCELEIGGESMSEILEALRNLDRGLLEEAKEIFLSKMEASDNDLKDIVEVRHDGPIIITKKPLSHYEAIGIVLYCSKEHKATAREIKDRLIASGWKVTVPARLNEMVKRELILKPEKRGSFYKLSSKGLRWVEEEVLPRLRS